MKTIEENNRLIADFMGQLFHNGNTFIPEHNRYIGFKNFSSFFKVSDLRYHCSWDWIIPVVEQIYDTELYEQEINQIGDITHALIDLDINGLHNAVVEFIEFYNKQN